MIANLSIVLDKDKKVRLDLIQGVELSQIDSYTTQFPTSSDIREIFQEEISQFLEAHQDMIQDFKKNSNRQGSLVIVYSDENFRIHRMRVLYQENKKKTDVQHVLKNVCNTLREQQDPFFTIDVMKNFSFFLGSPFDLREIEKIGRSRDGSVRTRKNQNQRLINLIRNHILYAIQQGFEKGYFYLRLIDAYMERKGFVTTKRCLYTKVGKVTVARVIENLTTLQKEQKYGQVQANGEQDFFLEEDGQYALFDLGISMYSSEQGNPEPQYYKYEHFLENSMDMEGQLELKL